MKRLAILRNAPKLRRGFTLVELLVTISVIAILVGLLLPAVQQARESMRRTKCANHLKQLGLALHNYHNTHRSFPAGYLSRVDTRGNDVGPGWGWASQLLPQLEQVSLYEKLNFELPIESSANSELRLTLVPTYVCPSDVFHRVVLVSKRDSLGNALAAICEVAGANYTGVFGITEPGVEGEGIFYRNSKIATQEITDGTSQTLIVGERSHRWGEATWVGAVSDGKLFPPPGSPAVPFVQEASSFILGHTFEGPPSAPGIECNNFSSLHLGGANVVFADGHIHFISSSTDKLLFRYLSTRSGNEVIGDY